MLGLDSNQHQRAAPIPKREQAPRKQAPSPRFGIGPKLRGGTLPAQNYTPVRRRFSTANLNRNPSSYIKIPKKRLTTAFHLGKVGQVEEKWKSTNSASRR